MNDASDPNDAAAELADLLNYSKFAIHQRATSIALASDLVTVSNAVTIQWLEMNCKFIERVNLRLTAAASSMEPSERPGDASMSYFERSEKFHSVTMENTKDYMQQFERFSLSAKVLVQRMAERYGDMLGSGTNKSKDE